MRMASGGNRRRQWPGRCDLIQLGLILVVLWSSFVIAAGNRVKECFGGKESDPPGNVTLTCPEGHVINIDEAVFGKNKWGACILVKGDCTEKTKIFNNCEGLNNCTRMFKTYSSKCGGYITVLRLSFSCTLSYATMVETSTTATTISTPWVVQNLQDKQRERTTKTLNLEKDKDNDAEEIGLIIGCVIASVITVIALIIAIIMVIRRLCQSGDKDETENNTDSPGSRSCVICICLEQPHCFKSSKSASKDGQNSAVRKKPSESSNTMSDKSSRSARMAPVGQENSSCSDSLESEDVVKSVNLDTINTEVHRTSHVYQNIVQNSLSHQSIENNHHHSHDNPSREPGGGRHSKHKSDKQKPSKDISKHPNFDSSNNNVGETTENKDISKNCNAHSKGITSQADPGHAEDKKSPDQEADQRDTSQVSKRQKSKFDAVAIPNTEKGTEC